MGAALPREQKQTANVLRSLAIQAIPSVAVGHAGAAQHLRAAIHDRLVTIEVRRDEPLDRVGRVHLQGAGHLAACRFDCQAPVDLFLEHGEGDIPLCELDELPVRRGVTASDQAVSDVFRDAGSQRRIAVARIAPCGGSDYRFSCRALCAGEVRA